MRFIYSTLNIVMLWFSLTTSAPTYKYIIDQQPIGRQLFRLFCDTKLDYKQAVDFLDSVVSILLRYQSNALVVPVAKVSFEVFIQSCARNAIFFI